MNALLVFARRGWAELGSMRFAVAILAIVAVAATAGSLIEQNPVHAVSVSHHGELLSDVFALLEIDDVYHAGWFLTLLAFLAVSTSVCVWRNAPLMLRELRAYKSHIGLDKVMRMPLARELPRTHGDAARFASVLREVGYAVKNRSDAAGANLTGRKGMGRRLGYLFTHVAVPLICIGGLLDANPSVLWQLRAGTLRPLDFAVQTPPASALQAALFEHGAFRGAVRLAAGEAAGEVSVGVGGGYLLRTLPFRLRLDGFEVQYHPSGQPRDFVSRLSVLPQDDEVPLEQLRVAMNAPASYAGIMLYQSGFDFDGSRVVGELLTDGGTTGTPFSGRVGETVPLLERAGAARLELQAYRPRNVLPTVQRVNGDVVSTFLRGPQRANTNDLGASVDLSLRDAAGQARTITTYLRPLTADGRAYWIVSTRDTPEGARHVRVPLDPDGSTRAYSALMTTLTVPANRAAAAQLVADAVSVSSHRAVVRAAAATALEQFAAAGLAGVGSMDTSSIARSDTAGRALLLRFLTQAAVQAHAQYVPAAGPKDASEFVADALAAYSEWIEAGRPPLVRVYEVNEAAATVLQVTHAPGTWLVLGGMALLCVGVALMVHQRERRIWIRTRPDGSVVLGMLAGRRCVHAEDEFDRISTALTHEGTP